MARNKPLAWLIVLALAPCSHASLAQEEDSGSPYIKQAPQGGWVMEFGEADQPESDNDTPSDPAVVPAAPVHRVGPGVEMIIGGQGEGGVAKRGTLPVVD